MAPFKAQNMLLHIFDTHDGLDGQGAGGAPVLPRMMWPYWKERACRVRSISSGMIMFIRGWRAISWPRYRWFSNRLRQRQGIALLPGISALYDL